MMKSCPEYDECIAKAREASKTTTQNALMIQKLLDDIDDDEEASS